MFVKNKSQLLHLLKKLWRWGALVCLVNLMHYGVAMAQCTPKVTFVSNNAPASTIQLKRINTAAFPLYTTVFDMDLSSCPGEDRIQMSLGRDPTIVKSNSGSQLSATYRSGLETSCSPFLAKDFLSSIVNICKDGIGNILNASNSTSLNTGLLVVITIDTRVLCGTGGNIFPSSINNNKNFFIATCSKYRVTYAVSRDTSDMTLSSTSSVNCKNSLSLCLTSGTIDYSDFAILDRDNGRLFDLKGLIPPVNINYSDSPPSCAVTFPPKVVMPEITFDIVTATMAGEAIPGSTIDLPITLNCQNADNQAKVFTWTFSAPSTDGFSILNDPTLNTNGSTSSAGISAQIFSTVDLTGRDKVIFTQNPTIIKNDRSYIATPTSNTTIVPHKVRFIRNSETTKIGSFISKATLTVDYQ